MLHSAFSIKTFTHRNLFASFLVHSKLHYVGKWMAQNSGSYMYILPFHFQRLLKAWFTLYTVSHTVLKGVLNLSPVMNPWVFCWLDKQWLGTAWKMEYFQSHKVIVKNYWPLRVNTVLLFLAIATHWTEPILEVVMPLNIRRWFLLRYLLANNMCWK